MQQQSRWWEAWSDGPCCSPGGPWPAPTAKVRGMTAEIRHLSSLAASGDCDRMEAALRKTAGGRWPNTTVSDLMPLVDSLADAYDDICELDEDASPAKVRAKVNQAPAIATFHKAMGAFERASMDNGDLRCLVKSCTDLKDPTMFLRYLRVARCPYSMWDPAAAASQDSAPPPDPEWPSVGPLRDLVLRTKARAAISRSEAAAAVRKARTELTSAMLDVGSVMGPRSVDKTARLSEAMRRSAKALPPVVPLMLSHIAAPSNSSAERLRAVASRMSGPLSPAPPAEIRFAVMKEKPRLYGVAQFWSASRRRTSMYLTVDDFTHSVVLFADGCAYVSATAPGVLEMYSTLVSSLPQIRRTVESIADRPADPVNHMSPRLSRIHSKAADEVTGPELVSAIEELANYLPKWVRDGARLLSGMRTGRSLWS